MSKEQVVIYCNNLSNSEFSNQTNSDCIPCFFSYFEEFWPKETDSFKNLVNQYPLIDLACGNFYSCRNALNSLSNLMGKSTINSYIGVDRYNIDENSMVNLINELPNSTILIGETIDEVQELSIQELQPDLSKNVTLYNLDMSLFLKSLPSRSVKILSIGGFDDHICKLDNPYRKDLEEEIQRVLAPNAYFLCAGSFLNVDYHSNEFDITEINKPALDWSEIYPISYRYLELFKLYKSNNK